MTNSRLLIAMIRSFATGDGDQFLSIAEYVANDAERAGKARVATEIREVLHRVKLDAAKPRASLAMPIATSRGELAGLVGASYPEVHLSDLVLNQDLAARIARLVREHREVATLNKNGLEPSRKFLLSGPPGTGKGMTAAAVASELGLPLFTILLDGFITKFMGETAAKLRLIFDTMNSVRGVYFFHEVDALTARDASEDDVRSTTHAELFPEIPR